MIFRKIAPFSDIILKSRRNSALRVAIVLKMDKIG